MANNVGRLIVELAASTATFQADLGKSVRIAEQNTRQINNAFRSVKVAAGALAGVFSVAAIAGWGREMIRAAEELQDLSESTGSTVESLSRLKNIAAIDGAEFGKFQGAIERLAAGMAGAEEGSSKTAEALRFLKIEATDPAAALEEIAKKLDKFADGAGKAAIAKDLFGKAGVSFISTLKQIAQAGDVAASVTTAQAQEASRLAEAYRTLSINSERVKNDIASGLVPALASALEQFVEGKRIAGGFFEALRLFGTINPFKDLPSQIREVTAAIEDAERAASAGGFFGALSKLSGNFFGRASADAKKQLEFLKFQQRQFALSLIDPSNDDRNDRLARQKAQLQYSSGKPGAGGGGRAMKEQVSDAQKYLETLEKQFEKTLDLTASEEALVKIYELERDAKSGLNEATKQQILDYAAQIDFAKQLKDAKEAQKRFDDDVAESRKRASQENTRAVEAANAAAQSARDQNESLKDQIAFLAGGEEAVKKLNDARLQSVITLKQEEVQMLRNAGAEQSLIDARENEIKALRERQSLIGEVDIAARLRSETEAINALKSDLFDIAGSAIEDLIVDGAKASDVLKQLEKDLIRFLTQQALTGLKSSFMGGGSGGGESDWITLLVKMIPMLFGGTPASSVPGSFTGPSFGTFANGGSPPVGRVSIVGERGPELFVPRQAGVIVPNSVLTARRAERTTNITINQTVMPGASTVSARQAATQAGDAVARALKRR